MNRFVLFHHIIKVKEECVIDSIGNGTKLSQTKRKLFLIGFFFLEYPRGVAIFTLLAFTFCTDELQPCKKKKNQILLGQTLKLNLRSVMFS